ncbi:MAG TPA: peptidoglycan-binding protein, partial [Clostridia bacterium]|nr:peptidoglycan-binding protein [Clostridia bacterium]
MRFQENPNTNADLIDLGGLQVHCFDISVGRPAPNATVRVLEAGSENVIVELATNASGLTEAINLPAPPFEYSMMPDLPQPFSTYDVSVSQEGAAPVLIRGVQIFPGATALQNIQLLPEQTSELMTITIPDPVLWGDFPPKIPEDMVKELPPATGLVVLPQPVVPEFVIVHAGVPRDASAPNYYVPFKDYIKNVASSEIYSNWPENTLRANIHAIISVTLNRVFTEWYRNMGFNFTITNSTAYDQSFTFGRNIFQEISVLVDEIFTSYITKPDIQQP